MSKRIENYLREVADPAKRIANIGITISWRPIDEPAAEQRRSQQGEFALEVDGDGKLHMLKTPSEPHHGLTLKRAEAVVFFGENLGAEVVWRVKFQDDQIQQSGAVPEELKELLKDLSEKDTDDVVHIMQVFMGEHEHSSFVKIGPVEDYAIVGISLQTITRTN